MSQQPQNTSNVRQNFHVDSEARINQQINMEMFASHTYLSMAFYFKRDTVAFPGFHKYFKKQSDEEREHAIKLMNYQCERGGLVKIIQVAEPQLQSWGTPLDAVKAALALEKQVNQSLLELHKIAGDHGDANMCDFLESEYLNEQVESIKELGDMLTRLTRCGSGVGEYIFDKDLMS